MKNPRIWESSSRPLFVRSIWLDSSVGGRRHFLLEDKPQKRINSLNLKLKREYNLRPTMSYENCEREPEVRNLELIGLSKAQYKPSKSYKYSSKPIKSMPLHKFYQDTFIRRPEMYRAELPSKRSSLQDITSTLSNVSNSDERLAERVLNWLDLAGKSSLAPLNTLSTENDRAKPTEQMKKVKIQKLKKQQQVSVDGRPDSVKPISITFNKDKTPIRYNRAQKFTEVCNNSVPFKRFSATVMSGGRTFERTYADLKTRPKTTTVRKVNHESEFEKQLLSKNVKNDACGFTDSRKQLHIFMPSLPKKSMYTDEIGSLLSNGLSELCKI